MDDISFFEIAVSIAAAVILFSFALKGFSSDVQKVGGAALAEWLGRLTKRPLPAFALGAALTAIVQSSSAVSGITVALVEAGTVAFRGSLPVFLGANVGTTSTAWLVAIDATILGPFLIILSAVLLILPGRISLFGRSILYLGVILLALQLISDAVAPLKASTDLAQWLIYAKKPMIGLAIGIVATALLQSSSVVVGLGIIAVQQGLLTTPEVIPIVIGSNIGTTSTALFASLGMSLVARRAAVANLLFNTLGVLLIIPFMGQFADFVVSTFGDNDMAVATAHLLFNLGVAGMGFMIIRPMSRILRPPTSI